MRLLVLLLSIIINISAPVRASDFLCEPIFEIENDRELVERFKAVDKLRFHSIRVFKNPEDNTVVVLLGESHIKFKGSIEKVDRVLEKFTHFAVEATSQNWREFLKEEPEETPSALVRSRMFAKDSQAIRPVDVHIPFENLHDFLPMLLTISMMATVFGYYLENAPVFLVGAGLLMAISLEILPSIAGLIVKPRPNTALDKFLWSYRHLITLRDIGMSQNIRNILQYQKEFSPLLAVIGIGHMHGVSRELLDSGFVEIDWSKR